MKNFKTFSSGIAMLILLLAFPQIDAMAQKKIAVTGTVSDATGPVQGVNVIVRNTTRNTQTDIDGRYKIEAATGETLVFSYVGMKSQEILIKNQKVLNVTLEEQDVTLQSVVVTEASGIRRMHDAVTSKPAMSEFKAYRPAIQENRRKVSGVEVDAIEYQHEDYESFTENQFEDPMRTALSTFSIDVDNASYTNIRRFINNGQQVPRDAVRIEEMVNFFKYDYPQPQGKHPFSINTILSDCPWNKGHQLLRIGLQGKILPTQDLPLSNLVFLVDVSGSMSSQNKLPLLVQSMKVLLRELRAEDKVSIVVYAGAAGLVLKPTPGNSPEIAKALENLNAGGSTAGGRGIELAYKIASENFIDGGNNRVILATDGDFNVGQTSPQSMEKLIEEKRKTGVFLTVLGFGMGNYKDGRLELLANKGNGNYAYIDNIQEANRFLGKEFKGSMFAIAKDVKIQIEFNPNQVKSYRLIGYENRKLRDEDFVNDVIDAGELGSGHSVTALYEIIPRGIKSEFATNNIPLKYLTVSPGKSPELATIKFRYKKPDGNKSIEIGRTVSTTHSSLYSSPDDFRFGAAVAWFGLMLRDSKLAANKSAEAIKILATTGISKDTDGYRAEFVRLLEAVE